MLLKSKTLLRSRTSKKVTLQVQVLSNYLRPAVIWSVQHEDIDWSLVPVIVPCAVATWTEKSWNTGTQIKRFLWKYFKSGPKIYKFSENILVTKREDPLPHGNSGMVDPPWSPLKVHSPPHLDLQLGEIESQLTFSVWWRRDHCSLFHLSLPLLIFWRQASSAPLSPLPQGRPLPVNLEQGLCHLPYTAITIWNRITF